MQSGQWHEFKSNVAYLVFIFFTLGSLMSLAMGLLFGGFAGYGAIQTSANPRNVKVALGKTPLCNLQILITTHFIRLKIMYIYLLEI